MPAFFTVLIPFRNAEKTLAETLDSVRVQTNPNWEMLLVDDHSTDSSGNLALEYAARDERIRVLTHPGKGIVDALNRGIQEVRSPWVVRMDADDRCHPRRLEWTLEGIQIAPDVSVWSGLVHCFPEVTPRMQEYIDWLNGIILPLDFGPEIFVESPLAHPATTIQTEALRKVGGYRFGDFPEDYDLWLRLFKTGHSFRKIPEVILEWRESEERLSRTDSRYSLESFRAIKAIHLIDHFQLQNQPVQIWGAGVEGKKWRKELEKHGVEVTRFFDVDPRKIGGRVAGRCPVLPWQRMIEFGDCLTLGAVGNRAARHKIQTTLQSMGIENGKEFIFVQ